MESTDLVRKNMRLIDANKLISFLEEQSTAQEDEFGNTRKLVAIDVNKMIDIIKEQPTAYDVEKVIDELKKNEMKLANSKMHWEEPHNPKWIEKVIRFSKAVAIVRRGGKDVRSK